MAESQECTMLGDNLYDNPSQLSQLLLQRAGSRFSALSSDSIAQQSAVSTAYSAAQRQPSPVRAPLHAPSPTRAARRVQFEARHVTPSLLRQNTAPASTGQLNETEREDVRRMYHTFDGIMDAPGDTQADPELFEKYTSGLLGGVSILGAIADPATAGAEEGSQDSARDDSQMVSTQSPRSGAVVSPLTINDDAETQARSHYAPTSPLKLLETPAQATTKRDGQGQDLSSAVGVHTTPGTDLSASAFFGFGDADNTTGMSLTQAFNATQAKTSPALGEPGEDIVFQRPSPNFSHTRNSSLNDIMSSPIKANKARDSFANTLSVVRSSSEPRADYESMQKSQERRGQEQPGEDVNPADQDSWELPNDIQRHYFRQQAKQRLNQEAARLLSSVSAPNLHSRRDKRSFLTATASIASSKAATGSRSTFQGRYDFPGTDPPYELSQPHLSPADTEQSPEPEAYHQALHPQADQSAPVDDAVKHAGAEQRVEVPHTSSHSLHHPSVQSFRNFSQPNVPLSRPQSQSQSQHHPSLSQSLLRATTKPRSSKETEVVMDSQPDPAATRDGSQPATLRYPSSPSINQYSINQTTMLSRSQLPSSPISSMIPMPPKDSSPRIADVAETQDAANGVACVPSSPPLPPLEEDEVIYDEHSYHEHSDHDDDAVDAQSAGDEMDLVRDEDDHTKEAMQIEMNDAEVPETLEHAEEELQYRSYPGHGQDQSANTSAGRSLDKGPSVIPETDDLEDTQPSFFPVSENYETAKEQQSASQKNKQENGRVENGEGPEALLTSRGSLLLVIANQPDTQHTVNLNDIDLPHLSAAEESDDSQDATIARSTFFQRQKKRQRTYGASRSPVKETDPVSGELRSSPQQGSTYARGWSPPMTQEPEMHAAVYAKPRAGTSHLTSRTPNAHSKTAQPQTRSGALKAVNKALLSKSPGTSPRKTSLRPDRDAQLGNEADNVQQPEPEDADVDMRDEIHADNTDEPMPDVDVSTINHVIATASDKAETTSNEPLVPNRVFAWWPGKGYYPATCMSQVAAHRLKVQYDDGTDYTLESAQVRALDLLPGDQVKIEAPGMKKQVYVVIGFKDRIAPAQMTKNPFTDRNGHATIMLEEKQRESLAAKVSRQEMKHVEVDITNIYLTHQLWTRLRDRQFQYKPLDSPRGLASQVEPVATVENATLHPPKHRKSTASLRGSIGRASSVASSALSEGNVFLNMVFALTSMGPMTPKDMDAMRRVITSNGGLIVEDGFDELFDATTYSGPPTSSAGRTKVASSPGGLQLREEHGDLRFVALIAQSHSRTAKYMQALALNIPCLHIRWLQDSAAAGRPLPFGKYLLPAGASTFLDLEGVVRSRSMRLYDPDDEDLKFSQIFNERCLLLRNQNVLIVEENSNGQDLCVFLTHAMGAKEVGQCSDVDEARDILEDGKWDWVFVNGKRGVLDVAAGQLLDSGKKEKKSTKKGGKKRKRDNRDEGLLGSGGLVRTGVVGKERVNLAGLEFVIQSLILGALYEE